MTTKEAIQAMLDGKKVSRPSWRESDYFMFDGSCFRDEESNLVMADFNGYDWEIYEEPKPKQTVTIEKWLAESAFDGYLIIEGTKEYIQDFSNVKVSLINTYEVEL